MDNSPEVPCPRGHNPGVTIPLGVLCHTRTVRMKRDLKFTFKKGRSRNWYLSLRGVHDTPQNVLQSCAAILQQSQHNHGYNKKPSIQKRVKLLCTARMNVWSVGLEDLSYTYTPCQLKDRPAERQSPQGYTNHTTHVMTVTIVATSLLSINTFQQTLYFQIFPRYLKKKA